MPDPAHPARFDHSNTVLRHYESPRHVISSLPLSSLLSSAEVLCLAFRPHPQSLPAVFPNVGGCDSHTKQRDKSSSVFGIVA
jgi:hypothetical protein